MSPSEIQELTQAKQLMEEGRIIEAYQIVLGLENRENFTAKELLLCKLLKAKFRAYLSSQNSNLTRNSFVIFLNY